ncbi:hypothetical protein QQ045_008798 [Rhodiola kirilowii]
MINPNDPQENPEAFPTKTQTERVEPVKHGPTLERKTSREDHDLKQGNVGNKRPPTRTSVGSEHSIDRSPLHPHYQAKITGRGSGSPSWEGKGATAHGTPGRSRLKNRDDDLDRGAAVPKFGEWDEDNPASADGFTHIFNQVREERHTGTPNITTENHDYGRSNNKDQKAKVEYELETLILLKFIFIISYCLSSNIRNSSQLFFLLNPVLLLSMGQMKMLFNYLFYTCVKM